MKLPYNKTETIQYNYKGISLTVTKEIIHAFFKDGSKKERNKIQIQFTRKLLNKLKWNNCHNIHGHGWVLKRIIIWFEYYYEVK